MGDEVLKHFAAILKANTREQDKVARFGGEEFVLILPNSDTHQGVLVAEKLKAITTASHIHIEHDTNLRISASFGVAHYCADDAEWSRVLHRADNALYRAKKQGRNQVVGLPYTIQDASRASMQLGAS